MTTETEKGQRLARQRTLTLTGSSSTRLGRPSNMHEQEAHNSHALNTCGPGNSSALHPSNYCVTWRLRDGDAHGRGNNVCWLDIVEFSELFAPLFPPRGSYMVSNWVNEDNKTKVLWRTTDASGLKRRVFCQRWEALLTCLYSRQCGRRCWFNFPTSTSGVRERETTAITSAQLPTQWLVRDFWLLSQNIQIYR